MLSGQEEGQILDLPQIEAQIALDMGLAESVQAPESATADLPAANTEPGQTAAPSPEALPSGDLEPIDAALEDWWPTEPESEPAVPEPTLDAAPPAPAASEPRQ